MKAALYMGDTREHDPSPSGGGGGGAQPEAEMSFWDHLEALRGVLLRIVTVVVLLTVVSFAVMPRVFDAVILGPTHGDFVLYRLFESITAALPWLPQFSTSGFEYRLMTIQVPSQFFIHLSTSAYLAVLLSLPIAVWLLWGFVRPALYENEKRSVATAMGLSTLMFYVGMVVGYVLVFPVTFRFLAEYRVSELVDAHFTLDNYLELMMTLLLVMGLVFELPLLCWLLGRLGVLRRDFFGRWRRHAVVALLVLAALVTPTGDPFTLLVVFLPIYLLYEASAWLVPFGNS